MIKIAPSLLSADFANLARDVQSMESIGADYLHLDVMDGHFVPNMTFGPLLIKAIRPYSNIPFDVHLMIEDPDHYIEDFVKAGANIITIHAEACNHLDRSLKLIKSFGIKASVALNPHTPIGILEYVLDQLDMILIMTVNPGFGGQSFLTAMVKKIGDLKEMLIKHGLSNIDIEVDGGIHEETAPLVKAAGANVLVAGNAVFTAPDRRVMIQNLRNL